MIPFALLGKLAKQSGKVVGLHKLRLTNSSAALRKRRLSPLLHGNTAVLGHKRQAEAILHRGSWPDYGGENQYFEGLLLRTATHVMTTLTNTFTMYDFMPLVPSYPSPYSKVWPRLDAYKRLLLNKVEGTNNSANTVPICLALRVELYFYFDSLATPEPIPRLITLHHCG